MLGSGAFKPLGKVYIVFLNIINAIFLNIFTKNESNSYANQNHRFQVRVDLPSPYIPNKRTQQVLEIAYMTPQKKIYEGQGGCILPIEGV